MSSEPSQSSSQPHSSSGWIWIFIPFLLLCITVLAGGRFVLVAQPKGGGYSQMDSPQKEYLAKAHALTQEFFWGGRREYFEISVSKRQEHKDETNHLRRDNPSRTVIVDRIAGLPFPERGDYAAAITWQPDASQVTFDLEGVAVSISTKNL